MNKEKKNEFYYGVPFEVFYTGQEEQGEYDKERIIYWSKKMVELKATPDYRGSKKGSYGNVFQRDINGSFRFIITPAEFNLAVITTEFLLEVEKFVDLDYKVWRNGLNFLHLKPSSETIPWGMVMQARPDIGAGIHPHDEIIIEAAKALNLPITNQEEQYGTVEFGQQAIRALGKNNKIIVLKNHGVLSVGRTLDEAGKLWLDTHQKAINYIAKNPHKFSS